MSAIDFAFHGQLVRVVVDAAGDPWWVAADLGRALELEKIRNSVANLSSDEKGAHTVDTLGGPQTMTTVNEAGLYRLIFASRKPTAEAFKRWLAHEVLPALRRTGRYQAPGAADAAERASRAAEDQDPPLSADYWLALVREARLTHGRRAAAQLWAGSPLPQVGTPPVDPGAGPTGLCLEFLQEKCEVTGDARDFLRSRSLLSALARYAAEHGLGWPGDRTVGNALRRLSCQYRDPDTGTRFRAIKRSHTGYTGIRLRS